MKKGANGVAKKIVVKNAQTNRKTASKKSIPKNNAKRTSNTPKKVTVKKNKPAMKTIRNIKRKKQILSRRMTKNGNLSISNKQFFIHLFNRCSTMSVEKLSNANRYSRAVEHLGALRRLFLSSLKEFNSPKRVIDYVNLDQMIQKNEKNIRESSPLLHKLIHEVQIIKTENVNEVNDLKELESRFNSVKQNNKKLHRQNLHPSLKSDPNAEQEIFNRYWKLNKPNNSENDNNNNDDQLENDNEGMNNYVKKVKQHIVSSLSGINKNGEKISIVISKLSDLHDQIL